MNESTNKRPNGTEDLRNRESRESPDLCRKEELINRKASDSSKTCRSHTLTKSWILVCPRPRNNVKETNDTRSIHDRWMKKSQQFLRKLTITCPKLEHSFRDWHLGLLTTCTLRHRELLQGLVTVCYPRMNHHKFVPEVGRWMRVVVER